jgi:hypothetical protein
MLNLAELTIYKQKQSGHGHSFSHHDEPQEFKDRLGSGWNPLQFMSQFGGELPQSVSKLQILIPPQKENIPLPSDLRSGRSS